MKSRHAFTLTELLVLIPVAALLAATLLSSVNNSQDKLKAALCLNNVRQWGLGCALYANDNNDYWPCEGIGGFEGPRIDSELNLRAWYNVVPPYLHQPRLVDLYYAGNPPTPFAKGIWICPAVTNLSVVASSLSVSNPYFAYAFNNRMCANGPLQFRRAQLSQPATTILMCDGFESVYPSANGDSCPPRHFGGANFSMGDGHAQWIAFQDFCRVFNPGCSNTLSTINSSAINGDWRSTITYHWFPYPGAPT